MYSLRNKIPKRSVRITRDICELLIFEKKFDQAKTELELLVQDSQPPNAKSVGYKMLSRLNLYLGKYRAALQMKDRYLDLVKGDLKNTSEEARTYARRGLIWLWGWNNIQEAKKEFNKAKKLSGKIKSLFFWMDYFYLCLYIGEFNEAERVIRDKFDTKDGEFTLSHISNRREYYPFPIAELHCAKQDCKNASAVVDSVYDFTPGFGKITTSFHLAECHIKQGQFEAAEKRLLKLQNIYDYGFGYRAIFYPNSFYLLGKTYEAQKDTEHAIINYEKFLDIWKDADEDLPELINAKKRLAELKGSP
ncbi:hypothetical protein BVY01_02435 [bacterium I07]|nr:hypothetical protein BVY01_02435 [bacterium I07]